jgi:hypothetical protein
VRVFAQRRTTAWASARCAAVRPAEEGQCAVVLICIGDREGGRVPRAACIAAQRLAAEPEEEIVEHQNEDEAQHYDGDDPVTS